MNRRQVRATPAVAAQHAESVAAFLAVVRADQDFIQICVWQEGLPGLWLRDGSTVQCLAAAQDILGNWSIFTTDGYVKQYFATEVM